MAKRIGKKTIILETERLILRRYTAEDLEDLYEYGFSNYKKYLILDKNNFYIDSKIYVI